MSFISKNNNEILVAGLQNTMFIIDVNKGELVRQVPTEHPYIMMKKARLLCAATTTGSVDLLDPTDFKVVKSWQAHGTIKDMDAQGEFVVTCGASAKQQGFVPDPFVNIFDLKNMSTITPLPFPAHAAYVRLHPKMLTTSIVLSQMGQLHVVDFLNPNTPNVRYSSTQYLNRLEIAPSGEAIAIVQNGNSIHLWGSPSKIRFTDFGMPIELPDPPQPPPPDLDWSNDT
jgi:PAB-dependent poly(A)-specific ribonuclease subunit 2